jgi:hypothetical protein
MTDRFNRFKHRIYFASKLHRAPLWRAWATELSPTQFEVCSTWHDSLTVEADESNKALCIEGWENNIKQIERATCVLVYGNAGDALNGTLVEIGLAIESGAHIFLVGTYPWGTWRHLPFVHEYPTIHAAFGGITRSEFYFPVKEFLLNDPA